MKLVQELQDVTVKASQQFRGSTIDSILACCRQRAEQGLSSYRSNVALRDKEMEFLESEGFTVTKVFSDAKVFLDPNTEDNFKDVVAYIISWASNVTEKEPK